MVEEVVELLLPVPSGLVVDATVGGGGHSGAVLGARPDLRLLGIDRDPAAVAAAGAALGPFGDRVRIVQGGFEDVADIVGSEGIVAILFDLGVSSPQLDRPVRGFSYWADAAPLDMRMDSAQALTADDGRERVHRGRPRRADRPQRRGALRAPDRRRDRGRPPARRPPATSSRRSSAASRRRPVVAAVTRRGARSRPSAWRSTASCRASRPASTSRCTCSRPRAAWWCSRTTRSRTAW